MWNGDPYSETDHQRPMRALAFILLLVGAALGVAAQSHPETSTGAVILDANGNEVALGKRAASDWPIQTD